MVAVMLIIPVIRKYSLTPNWAGALLEGPGISSYIELEAELMEDTGVCRGFHFIPLKVCLFPRDLFCVTLQIARPKMSIGRGGMVHMPAVNRV